jgi:hypothetical protein
MDDIKSNIARKKKRPAKVNPFIQMIEDKKRIDQAIQNGEPISALKDIKFVKPL